MNTGFDFTVIWINIVYFFVGRFPHGALGGIALPLISHNIMHSVFFGGLILG
jgi:hypothetical protein